MIESLDASDAPFPDMAAFARPIPGKSAPGGPSLRYDPVFLQIQQARQADDPSLPMGEWDRPPRMADWARVESLCSRVLVDRSKDLQVAWWLTEAWLHRYGTAGLRAGIAVVSLLVREFWDSVHPMIADHDVEARVAPFAWANEALSLTLKVQVPLVALPDHDPPVGNLDLWERTLGGIPEPPAGVKRKAAADPLALPKAGRAAMLAHGEPVEIVRLARMADDLTQLEVDWQRLSDLLDERLSGDAPSLAHVARTLDSLRRAVLALLEGRDPRAAGSAPERLATASESLSVSEKPAPPPDASSRRHVEAPIANAAVLAVVAHRDEAYRMLEQAAAFLERAEPHSPTPYLVKRAVEWGRMSLVDLMKDVLREDGDLQRYFAMLGIDKRAE